MGKAFSMLGRAMIFRDNPEKYVMEIQVFVE